MSVSARVALAANPASGGGRGAAAGTAALRGLLARGHDVVDLTSPDAAEVRDRLRAAVGDGVDAVVVVGGDGMVHLGAGATAGSSTALGVVAAGTGDDVARSLGLPVRDVAAAVDVVHRALVSGARRRVDAVRVTGPGASAGEESWFVGVLAAGFDAVVNERANRWRWPRGRARYVLAAARELPVFRPLPFRLVLDGAAWGVDAMLVAVANGPSYGGGMRICPDARTDDGLLDVLVLEPVSRAEFVRVFPRVYAGTHVRHPRVTVRRARRVELHALDARRPVVGYGDGERVAPLPLVCEAVPGALDVLVAP